MNKKARKKLNPLQANVTLNETVNADTIIPVRHIIQRVARSIVNHIFIYIKSVFASIN